MTKNALILATDIIEIAQQSGRRAGTSLEAIASEQGDETMLAVLTEMDILTVAKIVREHDATIPSIATWLMDAESIKQLLNVEPSYWQNMDEDHVFCAQTEAHSLSTKYVKQELRKAGFKVTYKNNDLGDWENDKDKVIWMLVAMKE